MSLTITGILILAMAGAAVLFARQALLPLLVFFIPFSGTAVLNVTSLTYGVTPAVLFSLLYLAVGYASGRYLGGPALSRDSYLSITVLILFGMGVLLSSLLAFATGTITTFMITQLIFLLFGMVMTVVFTRAFANETTLWRALAAYKWSAVVVSVWGLLQFVCFYAGVPYPAIIFNNSISDFADMFQQTAGGVVRIASVAIEPSFMAFSLLQFFTFGCTLLLVRREQRRGLWIPVGLAGLVLALSTSSSGYFGLAVFGLLLLLQRPVLLFTAAAAGALVSSMVLAVTPKLRDALYVMTIGKSETYSFQERTGTMEAAMQQFANRPILGGGWGSDHSFSIVSQLLASTGMVGTALFVLAIAAPLLAGDLTRRALDAQGPSRFAPLILAASNAFIVALAVSIVTGFKYVVLDMWFMWALLIALVTLGRRELPSQGRAPAAVLRPLAHGAAGS